MNGVGVLSPDSGGLKTHAYMSAMAVSRQPTAKIAPRTGKSKLYTRTGDMGTTILFGGGRLPKDHPRVDAYGTVDELNSTLGVALSFMPARGVIAQTLSVIQHELLDIGAEPA